MDPRVDTHERVQALQPCEQREQRRALERLKDVRAVATGYLANPSTQLGGPLTPSATRDHAVAIMALADAVRNELGTEVMQYV